MFVGVEATGPLTALPLSTRMAPFSAAVTPPSNTLAAATVTFVGRSCFDCRSTEIGPASTYTISYLGSWPSWRGRNVGGLTGSFTVTGQCRQPSGVQTLQSGGSLPAHRTTNSYAPASRFAGAFTGAFRKSSSAPVRRWSLDPWSGPTSWEVTSRARVLSWSHNPWSSIGQQDWG